MDDKTLLENYLLVLKSTIEVYIHGTLESSNSNVRKVLHNGLDETLEHQERLYNTLVDNNWYTISNIKSEEIKKVLNKC